MENDDEQVGRVLTRREVLALFGAAGAAVLVGCAPGQTEVATPTGVSSVTPSSVPTNRATQVPTSTSTVTQAASATATVAPTQTATETTMPTETATEVPTATSTASVTAEVVALPSCIVRPEQTEGPYFLDQMLNRSDIRSDPSSGTVSAGIPLRLAYRVTQVSANACIPFEGAVVDVWHCDAVGVYSGFQGGSGQQFLRGYQVTDASGAAEFLTIYPGWYQGRTVHIHFKVRTGADAQQGYEFTSQLYFDDGITDVVHALQPYASKGRRSVRNNDDGIYRDGGEQLTLQVTAGGEGYLATFDIGLQLA